MFMVIIKISRHVEPIFEGDDIFAFQRAADVGINRSAFKPVLCAQLRDRFLIKVGLRFEVFQEYFSVFHNYDDIVS